MDKKKEKTTTIGSPKITISLTWIIIFIIMTAGKPDLIDALVQLILSFSK